MKKEERRKKKEERRKKKERKRKVSFPPLFSRFRPRRKKNSKGKGKKTLFFQLTARILGSMSRANSRYEFTLGSAEDIPMWHS